jgi:glycosyltransferase involved in cell wall biosynthesis
VTTVLDVAGGDVGGAARWRRELDRYLAVSGDGVMLLGRDRYLTPGWLVRRERLARGADRVVAPNNVSFGVAGARRVVLLRNALHFLYADEVHLLDRMPRSFRAQVPVVRALARRAHELVVPCTAMAERVVHHVPGVGNRIVVRPHPISSVGPRHPADRPTVLVPVVPAPYKNLVPQLRKLLAAADHTGADLSLRVTARDGDLPGDLAADARVQRIGIVPHAELAAEWRAATAVFFPSELESFGYPLAEARAYGLPVIAADTAQNREIAGGALVPYTPETGAGLAEALTRLGEVVEPDGQTFAPDEYFDWLLGRNTVDERRN